MVAAGSELIGKVETAQQEINVLKAVLTEADKLIAALGVVVGFTQHGGDCYYGLRHDVPCECGLETARSALRACEGNYRIGKALIRERP